MAIDIEKKLAETGYKMLGNGKSYDDLILSILKSGDTRYLKAIPFLIYNYELNIEKIYSKTDKKRLFGQILAITREIFKYEGIPKELPLFDEKSDLNFDEFKNEFDMQKLASEKPNLMLEKQKIYAERDLHMWLSQLFTKKERQIIRSILEERPVSKTDYEYYSRKTRKKLGSIMNLQDFAKTLYSKTPKYDEELFRLKRLLEEEIIKKEKHNDISIQRFFVSNNAASIFFQKKNDYNYSKNQLFNININLKDIKNKEILILLGRYKENEHDFT